MNRIASWLGLCLSKGEALLLGMVLVFGLGTQVVAETKTASSGNVRAEFSFQPTDLCLTNPHLKIIRKGQTLLDQPPAKTKPGESCRFTKLSIVNLDTQPEPEIILDLHTGGAHCCTYSLIYHFDPKSQKYRVLRHDWGNVGYTLEDLNQDGRKEFRSADDRFAYAFASYAASGFPLQIWQYQSGKLIDVTRSYPRLIDSEATQLWQSYTQERKNCEPNSWGACGEGLLAAYLANKYLLGQGSDGWQKLRSTYQGKFCQSDGKCGGREQYFRELQKFLQQMGYSR